MKKKNQDRLGKTPYVLGWLSLIPFFGILFGPIAFFWGLVTRKEGAKKVMLLGLGGISLAIATYSALFFLSERQRGGIFDEIRSVQAKSLLNRIFILIEDYKATKGSYPDSLGALIKHTPKNLAAVFVDPTHINSEIGLRYFFYEKIDDHQYYLRSVGTDNIPFTRDDILPSALGDGVRRGGLVLKKLD